MNTELQRAPRASNLRRFFRTAEKIVDKGILVGLVALTGSALSTVLSTVATLPSVTESPLLIATCCGFMGMMAGFHTLGTVLWRIR